MTSYGAFPPDADCADTRADVNNLVKRPLDVRKASFLAMDQAVQQTGMEYGGMRGFIDDLYVRRFHARDRPAFTRRQALRIALRLRVPWAACGSYSQVSGVYVLCHALN